MQDFYIPYFTYSTTTPFCFQGRGEWTNGNSRRPLHHLLLTLNKQCLLFSREERANRGQSMRAFTLFTSHSQQATTSCSQGRKERTEGNSCRPSHHLLLIFNKQRLFVSRGGKSEQRAFHASLHIIYFTYSTSKCFLFSREERVN